MRRGRTGVEPTGEGKQGADCLPEIVVNVKDYVAEMRAPPAVGKGNRNQRNIIRAATYAQQ